MTEHKIIFPYPVTSCNGYDSHIAIILKCAYDSDINYNF